MGYSRPKAEERVMDQTTTLEAADQQAATELRSPFKARYGNFINGAFVDPVEGKWFDNPSPITGETICAVARSSAADIDKALDAAHAAKDAWGRTSAAERAVILNKIADRMEAKLE